jgi:DNA-binding CsgD family transcriptional regulator
VRYGTLDSNVQPPAKYKEGAVVNLKLRIYLIVSLVYLIAFGVYDIFLDRAENRSLLHTFSELVFLVVWVAQVCIVFWLIRRQYLQIGKMHSEASQLHGELKAWNSKTKLLRENLHTAIREQFQEWQLTRAEAEVGFLIVRGYDFSQIASLLKKSERTVRQQAIAIYGKTGFRNRAELTGFFLEGIFEIEDEAGLI